ncbi:hypothetical protein CN326_04075 [Bacillus sp. AFS018417]|uniref:enhanced serine sensitivity protein SseB n=1 Tax=unclassified Bacillus (in: firmicutes) TaxID=185979 RepID=UPI000BF95D9C|nr:MULTISPECIES: enhanced serine sensitivity protein SseB [unclassified Bacillus (in: firmicutes)]MCP1125732.1 enhanced serine sensitivity protein SseB [Bacillus sp. 3103sda1]PEZ08857.1 hypothetical protein CN326_04075 [Bacillus sp. AFS018417]
MDINQPLTNPDLIRSLEKLKQEYNQTNEYQFFKDILEAKFLAPVIINPSPNTKGGKAILNENTTLTLINITDVNGIDYLPAFTDWEELRKWNQDDDIQTLIFTFKDYEKIILEDNRDLKGFVLNPFGQNIIFGKEQIQSVNNSVIKVQKNESVMLGIPKDYPLEMVEALKNHLPKLPSVKKVYLMLMIRGEVDKSYLLVVDSNGEYNKIFGEMAEIATKYLKLEEKLDFVPFAEEFGRNAVKDQQPFYSK